MTVDSTSYTKDQLTLLAALVRAKKPSLVVELGTQQGESAEYLYHGMNSVQNAEFHTYDLFEDNYRDPPYSPTKSSYKKALDKLYTVRECREALNNVKTSFKIEKEHALAALVKYPDKSIDVLHVDICNHRENIKQLIRAIFWKTKSMAIFEGGSREPNHWQKECGFRSFRLILEVFKPAGWDLCYIPFDDNHGITVVSNPET